ncbi:hypothetical protein DBR34_18660, partial [Stenotrophomonas sp. HMWF003]
MAAAQSSPRRDADQSPGSAAGLAGDGLGVAGAALVGVLALGAVLERGAVAVDALAGAVVGVGGAGRGVALGT